MTLFDTLFAVVMFFIPFGAIGLILLFPGSTKTPAAAEPKSDPKPETGVMPEATTPKRETSTGVVCIILGLLIAGGILYHRWRIDASTVYEGIAAGSVGVKTGDVAPVRTIPFVVEHPGTEYNVEWMPVGSVFWEGADVDIQISDPDGKPILQTRKTLKPIISHSSGQWNYNDEKFTPLKAGTTRLQLTIFSPDLDGIHVLITGPEKRNGHRSSFFH